MIRQIDYNYKWRILYKTWQERLYSFWMLQALSKSLFSNMDLHTEPVAAIQVQHFKQDVGIQSTDVQERSHGITCSLRMSRGQWTKKTFLRLRFATRRPSQVPSALGASACVHEPNHIGMALWKNQPHLTSSYFFTRIWMYLGKIQILTRRRSRRNIATKPNCLAQLRSLLTSGLPKKRLIPLMDGLQTWSQLNDRWRHRNHLVVANVVASVFVSRKSQILPFWPSTQNRKTIGELLHQVGDSRAVLGRCSTPARQTVSAVELSSDQHGTSESVEVAETIQPCHQVTYNKFLQSPFFGRGGVDLELCAFDFSIYIYIW